MFMDVRGLYEKDGTCKGIGGYTSTAVHNLLAIRK